MLSFFNYQKWTAGDKLDLYYLWNIKHNCSAAFCHARVILCVSPLMSRGDSWPLALHRLLSQRGRPKLPSVIYLKQHRAEELHAGGDLCSWENTWQNCNVRYLHCTSHLCLTASWSNTSFINCWYHKAAFKDSIPIKDCS